MKSYDRFFPNQDQRHSAVLSDRKEHLHILQDLLKIALPDAEQNIFCLVGSLSVKARKMEMQNIETCAERGEPFTLFATSSLLGEGFDLPILDTLFLTFPVSYRGRMIQPRIRSWSGIWAPRWFM